MSINISIAEIVTAITKLALMCRALFSNFIYIPKSGKNSLCNFYNFTVRNIVFLIL